MVKPLVMQPKEVNGGYMVDGDLDRILPLLSQLQMRRLAGAH